MRQALQKSITVVGFTLVLSMVGNALSSNARASYGPMNALGTIGIGSGIGAVMGLSTIAFYSSPTSHLKNVLLGAGAGLLVGIGVAAYLMATSSDEDEINPDELLPPENKPTGSDKKSDKDPAKTNGGNGGAHLLSPQKLRFARQGLQNLMTLPQQTVLPVKTGEWVVALQVLELRF